jgi:hypothetical protein
MANAKAMPINEIAPTISMIRFVYFLRTRIGCPQRGQLAAARLIPELHAGQFINGDVTDGGTKRIVVSEQCGQVISLFSFESVAGSN